MDQSQVLFEDFRQSEQKLGSLVAENFFKDKLEYKIVTTKFDPINPTYSLVYKYSGDKSTTESAKSVRVFHLKRSRILNFTVSNQIRADIFIKSFQEAVDIAQKYDLSKENPDPENITVFSPIQPSNNTQPIVYPEVTIHNQQ